MDFLKKFNPWWLLTFSIHSWAVYFAFKCLLEHSDEDAVKFLMALIIITSPSHIWPQIKKVE